LRADSQQKGKKRSSVFYLLIAFGQKKGNIHRCCRYICPRRKIFRETGIEVNDILKTVKNMDEEEADIRSDNLSAGRQKENL